MTGASLLALPRERLARAARSVAPAPVDDDGALALFAAGAWSSIVEPGDRVAGALRSLLGPVPALRVVLDAAPGPGAPTGTGTEAVLTALAGTGHDLDGRSVAAALARWAPRLDADRCLGAFRAAAHLGAVLLRPGAPGWPSALDELGDHAPAALWARGGLALPGLDRAVALVGARASSAYGEQVTADLAAALGDRDRVVVSGGAYGIDGTAHRAALLTPSSTVAVLPSGVDHLYPRGNDELLRRVARDGAVVSESPCGTTPSRWRFLQRNRLIAAMTSVTVVVEAGRRSGSLNTAGHASVLGRPVGAVPGPVTSPSSAGCHALLRSGLATCVTGVHDVLELTGDAGPGIGAGDARYTGAGGGGDRPPPEVRRVLDAWSTRTPRTLDEVAVAAGLSLVVAGGVLAELELGRQVEEGARGWRRRAT